MKPGIHPRGRLRSTPSWSGVRGTRRGPIRAGSVPRSAPSGGREGNGSSPAIAERRAAIRITRRYSAPADRVFHAWLNAEVAARWLFATASRPHTHAAIDARIGGSFCFVERHAGKEVEYTGNYVEITPNRRLAFTLSVDQQPLEATRVVVEIAPLKTGCTLNLTHDRLPPADASRTEARWTGILYGLAVTLKVGGRFKSTPDPCRIQAPAID